MWDTTSVLYGWISGVQFMPGKMSTVTIVRHLTYCTTMRFKLKLWIFLFHFSVSRIGIYWNVSAAYVFAVHMFSHGVSSLDSGMNTDSHFDCTLLYSSVRQIGNVVHRDDLLISFYMLLVCFGLQSQQYSPCWTLRRLLDQCVDSTLHPHHQNTKWGLSVEEDEDDEDYLSPVNSRGLEN